MSRPQRAPGSFSPLPGAPPSSAAPNPPPQQAPAPPTRPPPRRVDSSESEDGSHPDVPGPSISITKTRQQPHSPSLYASHAAASSSLSVNTSGGASHNFSRPARGPGAGGAASPLGMNNHTRKHSATPGLFEPTLPSTSTSNLSQIGMSRHEGSSSSTNMLSASQIAAQAAVMSHQNSQQQLAHQSQQHSRQRSQTVPAPEGLDMGRRGSGNRGPVSPPMLSLTEASAPRDTGFGGHGEHHSERPLRQPTHSPAATAAANVVFPRSGHSSPSPGSALQQQMPPPPLPMQPPPPPEKPSKSEKARAKLFSRPSKISTKTDSKEKPLPSPGKIGSALSALQRGNFSTTSLVEPSSQALYSHSNSSAATIRPTETSTSEEKGKEKEKKHHFLSRQKHKLKDEFHLPLSSAASNSMPTDPNAPNPLYNFNIPASPGPSSSHFVKGKKEKKQAERSESRLGHGDETPGDYWSQPGSLPNLTPTLSNYDPVDPGKLGLHNQMSLDDAWPYLKAKLLAIFEGEDLRLPVEDFNRVVQMHIQYCIQRRSPNAMLEDLRDLLAIGFSSLDRTLRKTPEDRFIPTLVELWLFTFTSILPYIQSVFLPLDLEVSGCGTIMSPDQARDFWGGAVASPSFSGGPARVAPAAQVLDVRRLVLTAFRDIVILPRYETLKTIFSRLSLEFLPSMASPTSDVAALSTSPPESFSSMARPGTAMSLEPSVGSYNSNSTTLLGDGSGGSAGGRSRAISNVSFGSHGSDSALRPFTPSSVQVLGSVREQNVEDSKQVTDMVGRMLQCMSVLSSLGGVGDADDEQNRKVVELCKMLKLNWLGRGRTGRNRMGIVGGRVRREGTREELRVA